MKNHGYVASGELNDFLKEMFAERRKQDAYVEHAEESERSAALLLWTPEQRSQAFNDYCNAIAKGDVAFPVTKGEVEKEVLRYVTKYRTEDESKPEPKVVAHGDSLTAPMIGLPQAAEDHVAKHGPPINLRWPEVFRGVVSAGKVHCYHGVWTDCTHFEYEWIMNKWDKEELKWEKTVIGNSLHIVLSESNFSSFIHCNVDAYNSYGVQRCSSMSIWINDRG